MLFKNDNKHNIQIDYDNDCTATESGIKLQKEMKNMNKQRIPITILQDYEDITSWCAVLNELAERDVHDGNEEMTKDDWLFDLLEYADKYQVKYDEEKIDKQIENDKDETIFFLEDIVINRLRDIIIYGEW